MLAFITASLLIAIGLLATVLPVLPGTIIAFCGILVHKLWLGDGSVSWAFISVALAITVLTIVIDIWCTWWGARKFGASWLGAFGAVIGGIAGFLFFSLPGLVFGPIVGAVLFELMNNRDSAQAAKAGFGTIVGAVVAFFLKIGLTVGMVAAFYMALPATLLH